MSVEFRRYPGLTGPGKAQDEESNETCDGEQADRDYAQMNSDFGPVIRGEKTVVEEKQSQLSEKHIKSIDKYT